MTNERTIELETKDTAELTPEEVLDGYHFCSDFDGACINDQELSIDSVWYCPFCGWVTPCP